LETENQELKAANKLLTSEAAFSKNSASMEKFADDMRNQRNIWMRRCYERDAVIYKARKELRQAIALIGEEKVDGQPA
jgi:hypothetical protein